MAVAAVLKIAAAISYGQADCGINLDLQCASCIIGAYIMRLWEAQCAYEKPNAHVIHVDTGTRKVDGSQKE
jgi:hypothetical protein